ncbi:MAG: hypothetical protein QM747_14835 [Nocardioides sp.]
MTEQMEVDDLIQAVKTGIRLAGQAGEVEFVGFKLVVRTELTSDTSARVRLRVPVIDVSVGGGGGRSSRQSTTITLEMAPQPTDYGALTTTQLAREIAAAIRAVRATVRMARGGEDPWDLTSGRVDIEFAVTSQGNLAFGLDAEQSRGVTHLLSIEVSPGTSAPSS